jgi:xanthine dehydrogenase accessory factor
MKEVVADIERWRHAGRRVAIARVVGVEGSGPRDPGATMAVNEAGEVAGSVSGGCVEGAVVTEALEVLAGDGGARRVTFGYSDDEAFAVGLTCGGTVHLLIDALDRWPLYDELRAALHEERAVALATIAAGHGLGATMLVSPEAVHGSLGDPDLDRVVLRDARAELDAGRSATRHYGPRGQARQDDVEVFFESFAPPPRMVIFGAVDFTAALTRVAKVLGYRVTVCDARPVFATRQRFPLADEVVVDWPDRHLAKVGSQLGPRDAVCVLTHDHKFDVPAIVAALGTRVGYLGAMGSRRTHADRVERLRVAGVTDEQLERVMGPIGLDIGARTPEETAVSICAEIIAVRTRPASGRASQPGPAPRGAASLRDTEGPIHATGGTSGVA